MNSRYARALAMTLAALSLFCSNMMEEYDDGIIPSGGFLINTGDTRTVSRAVTLSMNITSAAQMRFSNDGATWSEWESYAAAKTWNLALGPQLQTVRGEFKSETGKVLSATDSIDTFIEEKIVASDGHSSDQLGGTIMSGNWQTGISMSHDGRSIIIACPYDDIDGKSDQGSAYLYQWTGAGWTEKKFTADDGLASDNYAWSVAISGSANRIAIGSMLDDCPNSAQGSVYIYSFNGATWDKSYLTASDGNSGDQFGVSVSLSNDGNTLIVGSYMDDLVNVDENYGSVFIYKWNGTTWDTKKIMASDKNTYFRLGWHVSITGDGTAFIAGAPGAQGNEAVSGAAYFYRWNGSDWIEKKIYSSDGKSSDFFGGSVTISNDGNTLAVGAPWNDIGTTNTNQGSVHVFKWDGINWNEKQIVASDGLTEDWFGRSVSLSGDGTRLLVGCRFHDVSGKLNQGSAYLYTWDGVNWNEEIIRASDGAADDNFGYSVFISNDGSTYGITAPGKDYPGPVTDKGNIYLY